MFKRSVCIAMVAVLLAAFAPVSSFAAVKSSSSELMIADFNTGDKPSNIGGDFGSWNKDPADFTQGCVESFDSANRHGDAGFAMKLGFRIRQSGFLGKGRCEDGLHHRIQGRAQECRKAGRPLLYNERYRSMAGSGRTFV